MSLSKSLENELIEEIIKIEEKNKMPVITTAEKIGIEKGMEKGIIKGEKKGLVKGMAQGLQENICDIFEIKFNEDICSFNKSIKQIQNIETLQKIRQGLKKVNSKEDAKLFISSFLS